MKKETTEGDMDSIVRQMKEAGATEGQIAATDLMFRAGIEYRKRCVDEGITVRDGLTSLGEAIGNVMFSFIDKIDVPPGLAKQAADAVVDAMSSTFGSLLAEAVANGETKWLSPARERGH